MVGKEFERLKQAAQQELKEKFGMEKISDFREALKAGNLSKASEWLEHIRANRERFPQYNDDWFTDRERELVQYQS